MPHSNASSDAHERAAARATLIAGIMQAAFALGVLLLPIMPAPCDVTGTGGTICPRLPYIQMEGSLVGYAYFLLLIGIGIGAVVLATGRFTEYACTFRWVSVLVSISFVILGAWSIGLIFLPGGVLMLFAAFRCFRRDQG
jgi:hypothetical protein